MSLSPLPTTKLHEKLKVQDRLLEEIPMEERHALTGLAHAHPHFPLRRSGEVVREALEREYVANGPSVLRILENRPRDYRTFEASASPVLRKRNAILGAAFRKKAGLLLAMQSLVRGCHCERVAHAVEKFRAVIGIEFMDGRVAGAERLVVRVRDAVARRGGEETAVLQPASRRLQYRPDEGPVADSMRVLRTAQ
jgi:hypothetical protein